MQKYKCIEKNDESLNNIDILATDIVGQITGFDLSAHKKDDDFSDVESLFEKEVENILSNYQN